MNFEDCNSDNEDEVLVASSPKTPVVDETEEARRLREEQESINLARMLMAEEAVSVYQSQIQAVNENPGHLSEEDLAVFRQLQQQDRMDEERERAAELNVDIEEETELSYDALLNLGERIGDVKKERWTLEAKNHIDRLPVEMYNAHASSSAASDNDSEVKCLVCQHEYEQGETLTRLPCGHVFHSECVAQWLGANDQCPYCRKSIVGEAATTTTTTNE